VFDFKRLRFSSYVAKFYNIYEVMFCGLEMKYLVLSRLRSGVNVTPAVVKAIADHYDLVKKLKLEGKLEVHYPLLGRHGGVSIYVVKSHEELQSLLVQNPLFNFNDYEIFPLLEYERVEKLIGKS
jgi:muconolactone delta-isomerase